MNNELDMAPVAFPISVFENLGQINETMTRARVRIFYKGLNRNGTYISEEFAEKLISTLPYTPIKGIYDEEDEDFEDHGKARDEGRIYGVVPSDNNVAFEDHEDEDGIVRSYACTDVLLWTAIYEEADKIIGAPQSMELYDKSIKGEWTIINGKRAYVFEEGCFLGLQVLGEDTEPCFQGASFYTLFTQFSLMYEKLGMKIPITGGSYNMDKTTETKVVDVPVEAQSTEGMVSFKLSDYQKESKIQQTLNATEYRYYIYDVYDEYVIAYDYNDQKYIRITYTKDDANDTVTVGDDRTEIFAEFVTQEEKTALNTIRTMNGTYAVACEKFTEQGTKIEEQNKTISTLTSEKETAKSALEVANHTVTNLQTEIEGLKEFKKASELAEKEAVFEKYIDLLDEETVSKYKTAIEDYTVEALDKELSYELVKSKGETLFAKSKNKGVNAYVPKDEPASGLSTILDRFTK